MTSELAQIYHVVYLKFMSAELNINSRNSELTCGGARRDRRTADPAVALLCSQPNNTRPPHFLNTQPRSHTHPPHLQPRKKNSTLSLVSRQAPSSSWGATCEKYFSVEIHFTHRAGAQGRGVVKAQLKGQWEGLWDGVTEWRERWREEE